MRRGNPFSFEKLQIMQKRDGLPHQSADWFAMTGSIFTAPFFDPMEEQQRLF